MRTRSPDIYSSQPNRCGRAVGLGRGDIERELRRRSARRRRAAPWRRRPEAGSDGPLQTAVRGTSNRRTDQDAVRRVRAPGRRPHPVERRCRLPRDRQNHEQRHRHQGAQARCGSLAHRSVVPERSVLGHPVVLGAGTETGRRDEVLRHGLCLRVPARVDQTQDRRPDRHPPPRRVGGRAPRGPCAHSAEGLGPEHDRHPSTGTAPPRHRPKDPVRHHRDKPRHRRHGSGRGRSAAE